jgi:hypothetical protein
MYVKIKKVSYEILICVIRVFYLPTDAQVSWFKNIKIYIKIAPTYFDAVTIIRECIIRAC